MNNPVITASVSYLLNQVSTVYYAKLEKSLNVIGLHYGQIFILISLWEKDSQTQKELADNISVSPPTVNKMIKSLERNGFISSQRCSKDIRSVRISLSQKGLEIRAEVEAAWLKLEQDIFSTLTETEKLILFQIMQKMKDNLFS